MALTSPAPQARPRRSRGPLPLASGLVPLPLAVAFVLGGGLAGAALDKLGGHAILVLFTIGLTLGSAVAVLLVQRLHLFATVAAIPLAYLVLVVFGAIVAPGDKLTYTVAIDFTLKAPAVFVATGTAALLALARRVARPQR